MQIFAFVGVREYQIANRLLVDGKYGRECTGRAGLLTSLEDEARFLLAEIDKKDLTFSDLEKSKPAASAVQEILNLLGYDINYKKYGADGFIGNSTMKGLRSFMEDNLISNMDDAVNELASSLFKLYGGVKYFRKESAPGLGLEESEGLTLRTYDRSGKTRVEVSDGITKKEFTRFKLGLFTNGNLNLSSLDAAEFSLQKGVMKILSAVSDLEGKMDAINTWDNSFMSIGCFQWTLGTSDKDGELGSMLYNLKKNHPSFYEEKFLKYGFDVDESGECSVRGVELVKDNKSAIRTPEWAFRFWESCQHYEMQSVMVDSCKSRLKSVLGMEIAAAGMTIQDLFKDCLEGYAQCLQIHVNRPAYLDNIVALAIQDAMSNPKTPSASKYNINSPTFQRMILEGMRERSKTYGKTPVTDAYARFDKVKSLMKV